jgi:hypothetical protein
MSTAPAKVNPDYWSQDDRLFILNKFRDQLIALKSDPVKGKAAADGLKVVDCLRFIKVNEPFISYAFKNRNDRSVYTFSDDLVKGALRDFNNTSFHINLYNNEKNTPEENLKTCLEDFQTSTRQFEEAYNVVVKENKLNEFIDKLTYDDTTGCLALRTIAAQMYAKEIETLRDSKTLAEGIYFEELMNKVAANFDPEDEDKNYKMVYDFFEPYIGKWCRYEKSDEIQITYDFIIKYMCEVMSHEPPNVIPGQNFYDEYMASNSAKRALDLIPQERSLVKVFDTTHNSNNNLSFIFNQIANPANVRPIPHYDVYGVDRTKIWDPKDRQIKTRKVNPKRGLAKRPDWKYTKKTSATLLPTDGKITLFKSSYQAVGIQFNIDLCNIKGEKYIWKDNALTDNRWWLADKNSSKTPSITLEQLRQHLRDGVTTGKVPYHNEILACFAQEGFTSVFATEDTLIARLNVLRVKHWIKDKYNIDVPLLIITPTKGASIYTKKQILADIQSAQDKPHSYAFETLSATSLDPLSLIKQYQKELLIEETADVYKNSVIKIFELCLETERFDAALQMLERKSESFVLEQEHDLLSRALYFALDKKDKAMAMKLLSKMTLIRDTVTVNGTTNYVLRKAAMAEMPDVLDEMLSKVFTPLALGHVLSYALEKDNNELALRILQHQFNTANCNFIATGENFLLYSLKKNNQEIVKSLLLREADPLKADKQNITSVDYVLTSPLPNKIELLNMFLESQKDKEANKWTIISKIIKADTLSEDEIVNIIQKHTFKFDYTQENELFNTVGNKKLHKVYAALLFDKDKLIYSGRTSSWNTFARALPTAFTDEQCVYILEMIEKKLLFITYPNDKTLALEYALTSNRPKLAARLIDIGATLSSSKFIKFINSGEPAITLIESGRVSAKTLIKAQNKLAKSTPPSAVQLKIAEYLANTYQTSNLVLAQHLQEYVNNFAKQITTTPPKSGFSFFQRIDPAITLRAINKLIKQLKTNVSQPFTPEEITAFNSAKLSSLLATFKNEKAFLNSSVKLNTQLEIDTATLSKRNKGNTLSEKLANSISAIDADLRQQHDKLIFRLLKATNPATRENITDKLNATLAAQEALHAYQRGSMDIKGLQYQLTQARDQARAIRPETTWGRITSRIKRIFGKHLGDSTTAKIISHAVADISVVSQDAKAQELPSMASTTRKSSISSSEIMIQRDPQPLLTLTKDKLIELVDINDNYTTLANQILKKLAELEEDLNKPDAVINFRKAMHNFAEAAKPLASFPGHKEFQDVIYNTLLAAAIIEPVNNENQEPINFDDLADIPRDSVIYLSDGYFFETTSLVEWIQKRGIMDNPVTRGELMENDKSAIISAAKRLDIDLKNLNPATYKVEEDVNMLNAAVALALGTDEPIDILQAGQAQALQNFGQFQPAANSYIQAVAEATGKSVEYWKNYQAEHPFRFTRIANSAPYIKQGFLTIDQAVALSPDQAENLALLTTMETDLPPDDLAAQVRAIINTPNNSHRP